MDDLMFAMLMDGLLSKVIDRIFKEFTKINIGNSKYYDECAKILCDSMLDGFKLRVSFIMQDWKSENYSLPIF